MLMNTGILVTGGSGFIGSNFVLQWTNSNEGRVVNLDALTYASSRSNLVSLEGNSHHIFVHGNICDSNLVADTLATHKQRAIIHFAAESHVVEPVTNAAYQQWVATNYADRSHSSEVR